MLNLINEETELPIFLVTLLQYLHCQAQAERQQTNDN